MLLGLLSNTGVLVAALAIGLVLLPIAILLVRSGWRAWWAYNDAVNREDD